MNDVRWQDIVKIKGNYYLETFKVDFEDKRFSEIYLGESESEILEKIEEYEQMYEDIVSDPLYDCSDFFKAIQDKYKLSDDELDDVETYLFDDLDLPMEVCKKFDIAWLGGYINGINI